MEEGELGNFVKVWTWVVVCLSYCYFTGKLLPKGILRFLAFLPVMVLFFLLPRNLSSVHFAFVTGFYVTWLANFKLALFALGHGHLAADPSISLLRFIPLACLPIKIRQKQSDTPSAESDQKPANRGIWFINHGSKGLLLAVMLLSSNIEDILNKLHPTVIFLIYMTHVYVALELAMVLVSTMARVLMQMDLEPQFNNPFLSTSLQDFWGRRWNLMVTNTMRLTVYDPIRRLASPLVGKTTAASLGVLGTFLVSGLMHELVLHYLTRLPPPWGITRFFVLHGVWLIVEVPAKKWWFARSDWRLPVALSRILVMGFLMATDMWLILPDAIGSKVDARALEEYAALGGFIRSIGRRAFVSSNAYNATGF